MAVLTALHHGAAHDTQGYGWLVWFGLAVMYHVINVATLLWYPISTVFF
jgi:hypothetical protein